MSSSLAVPNILTPHTPVVETTQAFSGGGSEVFENQFQELPDDHSVVRNALVLYYRPGCPACERLKPTFTKIPKALAEVDPEVLIYIKNTSSLNFNASEAIGGLIKTVPKLIFLDKKGKVFVYPSSDRTVEKIIRFVQEGKQGTSLSGGNGGGGLFGTLGTLINDLFTGGSLSGGASSVTRSRRRRIHSKRSRSKRRSNTRKSRSRRRSKTRKSKTRRTYTRRTTRSTRQSSRTSRTTLSSRPKNTSTTQSTTGDVVSFEDILYLVHRTYENPQLWENKEIKPPVIDDIRGEAFAKDQFPGAYFSLVTKYNEKTENLFPGDYTLYFSKELLHQKNYHINIKDHNGHVMQHNTMFPWQLMETIKNIKRIHRPITQDDVKFSNFFLDPEGTIHNEVIFHDSVSFDFLLKMTGPDGLSEQYKPTGVPDMTKLPFYVYPFEKYYTGTETEIPKSDVTFFTAIAKLAVLSEDIKGIDDFVETLANGTNGTNGRAEYLFEHRDEQDLVYFKTSPYKTILIEKH